MNFTEQANIASNIATVVVAAMNVATVLILYWQIKKQTYFFATQSKRDARAEISRAYRETTADMIRSPTLASTFYSWARTPEIAQRMAAFTHYLNVLHLEYRYAESHVHQLPAFTKSLNYFADCFLTREEINDFMGCILKVGFPDDFEHLFMNALERRLGELTKSSIEE